MPGTGCYILCIIYAITTKVYGVDHLNNSILVGEQVYTGPVTFSFLNSSSLILSERTYLSTFNLESRTRTPIIGSEKSGGYVDGKASEARFTLINDVVVQGNYYYIADFTCVRVYDSVRKLIATLAGSCGRLADTPTTTIMPPTFNGHLKLAVSARDLYVLDSQKISRVDRETGVTRTLSAGQHLTDGYASSIEVDKYANMLFVAVVTNGGVNLITVDIASGKQSLYITIPSKSRVEGTATVTAMVASIAIAPTGEIYVLEPTALHSVNRETLDITTTKLDNYGYHEIAVSSRYAVLSQEFYSRMYKIHLVNVSNPNNDVSNEKVKVSSAKKAQSSGEDNLKQTIEIFENRTFYLAVVFPSVLFLLVIVVTVCATRKILQSRNERQTSRPESDIMSEKYFLNHDNTQWI